MTQPPLPPGHLPGGFLIAIEGIDGAGKSTLARALCEALEGAGIACVQTKEPTQGPFGQQLRESAQAGRLSPEQELELLIADRKQHVAELLWPSLAAGKVVILDRYYLSNVAYQGASGLDIGSILETNEAFAPPPNLLLILDVSPQLGISRIIARGDAPNAFEGIENLVACRAIFAGMAHMPGAYIVDASKPAKDVLAEALQHFATEVSKSAHRRLGFTPEAAEQIRGFIGPALFA